MRRTQHLVMLHVLAVDAQGIAACDMHCSQPDAHIQVSAVAVQRVDVLAHIRIPQQHGHIKIRFLPRQRSAHRCAKAAAAKYDDLLSRLQDRPVVPVEHLAHGQQQVR